MTEELLKMFYFALAVISAVLVVVSSMIISSKLNIEFNAFVVAFFALIGFCSGPKLLSAGLKRLLYGEELTVIDYPRPTATGLRVQPATISIDSVRLSLQGAKLRSRSKTHLQWEDDSPQFISFHFIPKSPDLVAPLSDLDALRQQFSEQPAGSTGELVSLNVEKIQDYECVSAIRKFSQSPHGVTYIGSVIIPFRDFSFVIKIQCPEIGMTGMREAALMGKLMQQSQSFDS